jgi:PAS domain S-box-containing protein
MVGHRCQDKCETIYRHLFEKTPAMLQSTDASGCLSAVSDLWLSTMGYRADEVIGRPATDFLTDQSRRFAEEHGLPAPMASDRCSDVECQLMTKSGDIRDVLFSAVIERNEQGRYLGSMAVLTDVTKRTAIEKLLTEKTAALERSNRDLARFAYIASHDLQEPLRRVVTYCQILMEDFGTEVSEEAAEVIEIIQSGGKRMRAMINDLLLYSRLNDQLDRDIKPVDMTAVFCHAADDLAAEIEATRACVDQVHLPLVWGHAELLQAVLRHLLSNAIKYTGDEPPHIEVSILEQGGFWQFAIADHGIGIESRFADRIFEIFQRLHRKDAYQGSGMGLAIAKLIIEGHGGNIWLDTAYEHGARFLFTLPNDRTLHKDRPCLSSATRVSARGVTTSEESLGEVCDRLTPGPTPTA